jgi:nicotinate (nicotinamide) nucleotide adenylyltransferase
MKPKIAVGGSAANPPHLAHKEIIEALINSNKFEKIIWIPSGLRNDKPGFIEPEYRLVMTNLTLPRHPNLEIKFTDVFGKNTSTITWLKRIRREYPEYEIVWFTGIDSVVPQEKFTGQCEIQATWDHGLELINNFPFLIIPRPDFPDPMDIKIPLVNYEIFKVQLENISSREIRELISRGDKKFATMVTPEVGEFIKKHRLYNWPGQEK